MRTRSSFFEWKTESRRDKTPPISQTVYGKQGTQIKGDKAWDEKEREQSSR